jgi:hypothetical protein
MAVLSADFESLTRAIGMVAGWGTPGTNMANWDATDQERANDILDAAINTVCTPPPDRPGGPSHRWTWLYPLATLSTVAAYSTGTVTIVNGTVELADGTWPSWAAAGVIIVEGTTYTVATRTDDDTLVLDDTSDAADADAGTSYELARPAYDLPDDFGEMDGPLVYSPGTGIWSHQNRRAVQIVDIQQIQRRRQFYDTTLQPWWAAIVPKTFVTGTGQRWEIRFYPLADAVYTLGYQYRVNPSSLATTGFPPGGQPHAETFRAAVQAETEMAIKDIHDGPHRARFRDRLAASIAQDARMAPDTLGVERGQVTRSDYGDFMDAREHVQYEE